MATTWAKESNTTATSTGSTASTSFELDSGQSFLVKNSSSSNIMSLAENTGNLDVTGTINLGSSSYMTLNNNEIDVSSGDLTVDVAGDIIFDAGGTDIKFYTGGTSYLEWNAAGTLSLLSAGDTDDYLKFTVGIAGVTTISTNDDAGTVASLTLDIDGNINFDTATNQINLKDNGTVYARFINSSTNLVIQSGASYTTALTFVGANVAIAGQFACNGQSVAAAPNYTISNGQIDRALDCDSTNEAELADVLGQVITDLIAVGVFQ